jgi:putative component of toxin-antitoxin plasmid stabilization module
VHVGVGQDNTSNAKSVAERVLQYRSDWGPGYRVYFGRDGEADDYKEAIHDGDAGF